MHFTDALHAVLTFETPARPRAYRRPWLAYTTGPNFIFLVPGSTFKVDRPPLLGIGGYDEGTELEYHGHVDAKHHEGYVCPWQPTQDDMMANDWELMP